MNLHHRNNYQVEVADLIQGTVETGLISLQIAEQAIAILQISDHPALEPCCPIWIKLTLYPDFIAKLFCGCAHTTIIVPTPAGDYYQKIGMMDCFFNEDRDMTHPKFNISRWVNY